MIGVPAFRRSYDCREGPKTHHQRIAATPTNCQDGDVVNGNMMIDHVEKPSGLAVLVFHRYTRIKSKEKSDVDFVNLKIILGYFVRVGTKR
jgi:hypothetical protein